MGRIVEIADGCVKEAAYDYVGLWQIAARVRRECGELRNEEVKDLSLKVVRRNVDQGLLAGDYLKSGFNIWDEHDADAVVGRIKQEWNLAHGDPTLAAPICWFRRQGSLGRRSRLGSATAKLRRE